MLLSIILGKNHRIAFEDPTYKQAYHVLSGLADETVPVPGSIKMVCVWDAFENEKR